MVRSSFAGVVVLLLIELVSAGEAVAQPLGTFSWQLQPYCNRLTFVVTKNGPVFTLDGFDDQCGGAHTAAVGVASINPNGSVSLGITLVPSPPGIGGHLDVTLDVATLSGTWHDSFGDLGAFAFNASTGGDPRPSPLGSAVRAGGYFGTARFGGGYFFGLAHQGPTDAPTAVEDGESLARFGGGGHTGVFFHWPTGLITVNATEDWTTTRNGTEIQFMTTPNGNTNPTERMTIADNGAVGIGTTTPADRLHVSGDIRTQTGCVRNGAGAQIAGVCASDVRFKRDITTAPAVLNRLTGLRPVHFYWRAEAFPERSFGPHREYGLVAHEVEDVLPELVSTDADGYKRVDYSALPLLAVQAIKELKADSARIEAQNGELATRLATLEAELRRLTGSR